MITPTTIMLFMIGFSSIRFLICFHSAEKALHEIHKLVWQEEHKFLYAGVIAQLEQKEAECRKYAKAWGWLCVGTLILFVFTRFL